MINTISKTLESQKKTQDIKQSPSMKIGTKAYVRSRKNELTEVTGCWTERWYHSDRTPDQEAWQKQRPNVGPDAGGRSIGCRTAESGRVQRGSRATKMRPDASGQDVISVRSVAEKQDFIANDYFLSGAYKYNPQPTK